MPLRRAAAFSGFLAFGLMLALSLILRSDASASAFLQASPTPPPEAGPTPVTGPTPSPGTPNLSISDEVCLSCHGVPGEPLTLENGEQLDLFTPAELHQNSVHGELGYACVQCHTDVGEYPHPAFTASDRREVTLRLNVSCSRCHAQQFQLVQDSVHAAVQAAGEREAAVCVDCHTAHEVRRLNDPDTGQLLPEARTWIPERCALCHNAIYQRYRESVHGSALSEGNPDVPTCIDCHGVHNIEDPRTSFFRLRSPDLCARCHTDGGIMLKYGLNTNVLDTYVSDFHGTTVAIFERQSPDAEVNKPVCYDCHGVHDISRVDDPQTGLEMQENLLSRCQVCHPDATAGFPSAWMSHYIPSPEHYPMVYYVNLFYRFFIPVTLGGMALLVLLDAGRMMINRSRRNQKTPVAAPEEILAAEVAPLSPDQSVIAEQTPAPADPEPEVLAADYDGAPELIDAAGEDEEIAPEIAGESHADETEDDEAGNISDGSEDDLGGAERKHG